MTFEDQAKKKAKQFARDLMTPKKKRKKPPLKKRRRDSDPKFMKDL